MICVGSKVCWKLMGRIVEGKVLKVFTVPTEIVVKGKKIKKNGSLKCPAILVESEAGNLALKLQSELFEEEIVKTKSKIKPKMFGK